MLKFIKEIFYTNGTTSKSSAKSRLHFVLVQDRTGLKNEEIASFKKEMIEVIEKYFVIDESGFDIDYKRDSDVTTLVINSPIVVRRQDTISSGVGNEARKRAKINQESAEEAQV